MPSLQTQRWLEPREVPYRQWGGDGVPPAFEVAASEPPTSPRVTKPLCPPLQLPQARGSLSLLPPAEGQAPVPTCHLRTAALPPPSCALHRPPPPGAPRPAGRRHPRAAWLPGSLSHARCTPCVLCLPAPLRVQGLTGTHLSTLFKTINAHRVATVTRLAPQRSVQDSTVGLFSHRLKPFALHLRVASWLLPSSDPAGRCQQRV